MTEHTLEDTTRVETLGGGQGWRWACTCGKKGTPNGILIEAQRGGRNHERRMRKMLRESAEAEAAV